MPAQTINVALVVHAQTCHRHRRDTFAGAKYLVWLAGATITNLYPVVAKLKTNILTAMDASIAAQDQ
jgi:hypothetical protein